MTTDTHKIKQFSDYLDSAFEKMFEKPKHILELERDSRKMIDFISKNSEQKNYSLGNICDICDTDVNAGMAVARFLCNSVAPLMKPVYFFKDINGRKEVTKSFFIEKLEERKSLKEPNFDVSFGFRRV